MKEIHFNKTSQMKQENHLMVTSHKVEENQPSLTSYKVRENQSQSNESLNPSKPLSQNESN